MTNKVFIFLLLTLQLIAFTSKAGHTGKNVKIKFRRVYFVPLPAPTGAQQEFLRIKKLIQKNRPILRVDKAKWKEDLTRLLRHRYSSYAFPTMAACISCGISIVLLRAISRFAAIIPSPPYRVVHLPGYYSFLHRLCPF